MSRLHGPSGLPLWDGDLLPFFWLTRVRRLHCQNPYSRHFDLTEFQAIAAEAYSALDTGHQIAPFLARLSEFDFDDAYHVAACNKADARDARRSCDTFLHSD